MRQQAEDESARATETTLGQDLVSLARHWLGGWRGLLIVSGLLAVGGAVFNWSWLVAAGIAPIILAVLPCVAMCALGLCMMNKAGGASCSSVNSDSTAPGPGQSVSGKVETAPSNETPAEQGTPSPALSRHSESSGRS